VGPPWHRSAAGGGVGARPAACGIDPNRADRGAGGQHDPAAPENADPFAAHTADPRQKAVYEAGWAWLRGAAPGPAPTGLPPAAACLDEGLLSFCLPILVCMENPYKKNK
jgi:hypothetical protein